MRAGIAGWVVLALASAAGAAESPCGETVACRVAGGDYRIALPEGALKGAYVYFHGYGSSAAAQMRQERLVRTALAHHLAFVALDGVEGSWSIPGGPERARDDQAYLRAVLADLERRHSLTPARTVVGGFSLGASMAWYAACRQGTRFAGMLTFSGVFWDPLPEPSDCIRNLPPMIHVHGRADGTFPLAGRAIGRLYHQGDTVRSMAIYRQRSACRPPRADQSIKGDLACEVATGCLRGESRLCLHEGGHVVRTGDLDAGLTALGFPR